MEMVAHFPNSSSTNMTWNSNRFWSIRELNFFGTSFNSSIPSSFGYLHELRNLDLSNDNLFSGVIPENLFNCSFLIGLYLSDNNISDKIPRWLGNLSFLEHITMPNNHLEGPILVEFCQPDSLQILDILENNLSRSLPFCFSPLSIR
ncbi:hypothetical protein CUMW_207150 [Citrus unshiu]|uniref:Leucine-rich repeat-containing N-terminal plant-type domain-containing protein n=1 Tax=Citrus unshiu TaxID=55188 RepID=A0A2H5Q970_CITUN|nr:hypothetical protein CUMW_207150 [Citrus unshiu]